MENAVADQPPAGVAVVVTGWRTSELVNDASERVSLGLGPDADESNRDSRCPGPPPTA
jgi:hypothetical protein